MELTDTLKLPTVQTIMSKLVFQQEYPPAQGQPSPVWIVVLWAAERAGKPRKILGMDRCLVGSGTSRQTT